MGSCFSLVSASPATAPTAKVIALDGSLKEYSSPVPVSSALCHNGQPCFLCSSDSLYFDSCIPALASDSMLELDQIYFVLPIEKLDYPLSGSDMAALAVKASAALAHASRKRNGDGRRVRVMPVAQLICEMDCACDPGSTLVMSSIVKGRRHRVRGSSNRVRLDTIEEVGE